jgi:hypothetical protein
VTDIWEESIHSSPSHKDLLSRSWVEINSFKRNITTNKWTLPGSSNYIFTLVLVPFFLRNLLSLMICETCLRTLQNLCTKSRTYFDQFLRSTVCLRPTVLVFKILCPNGKAEDPLPVQRFHSLEDGNQQSRPALSQNSNNFLQTSSTKFAPRSDLIDRI